MAEAQPMIREQAALYLQIQQWLDLEAKLRELQAQVEKATEAEMAADMRAAAATQEAVVARAELTAANQRITALMAEPDEDGSEQELATARGTIDELRRQLAQRDPAPHVIAQSLEALQSAQAALNTAAQAPAGPTPDFDIIIQRNSEGFLQKLTVKEKR